MIEKEKMFSTKIGSIALRNPLILASGILGETAGGLLRVAESGAGAIVTKSIGARPRDGYPNPCIVELEHGLLNAMGLPNPGIDDYGEEIGKLKRSKKLKIPIIGSIFGSTANKFAILGKKMEGFGVEALELNMGCPHAKGYGAEIGSNPKLVESIVSTMKGIVGIPVFVKISPIVDVKKIAKSAIEGGADGIVAINSVKAMKIDIDAKMPVLSNGIGGYSGPAIKPIGIRCVYEIAKEFGCPIIGVGGIITGEDVIEYLMAGASAVQIGSGIHYRGIDIFKKLIEEIGDWMIENGYKSVSELVGLAL
jgi:dihydroorotate dehydrogenase (NAD+) catalytic subunit